MGHSRSIFLREVCSNIGLHLETRKISNKESNIIPKGTIKRKAKPKVSRRKEIIKIRAEISEIDSKTNKKNQ